MAKQTVNIGSAANDGTGDPARTAFDKVNDNFDELYLGGYWPQTAAEIAVSVTPVNYQYPPCNVLRYGTNTTPGTTDMTAALQASLNVAGYGTPKGQKVVWPAGIYLTSDTLHVGYGVSGGYTSITIEGDGAGYRGESGIGGTIIKTNFSNRPAMAVQGARGTTVRGVAFSGLLATWISSNSLCGTTPGIDDTVSANWDDPGLHANHASRYAPYAAVAIDPYSGTRPGTSYPDVTYPAFLGVVSQYGKDYSSDVLFERCFFYGFHVGAVIQPCNADGNGDFINFNDCYWEKNKYSVSVCQSQSRNVSFKNPKIYTTFVAFTNNTHGKQVGKFGGPVDNMSGVAIINLFDFGSYYSNPITFNNCYIERLWKLGSYWAGGTQELGMEFNNCQFAFQLQSDVRGHPAQVLIQSQIPAIIHFNHCAFEGYKNVVGFDHPETLFTQCTTRQQGDGALMTETYQKLAYNATCGGIILKNLSYGRPGNSFKQAFFNIDTGVLSSLTVLTDQWLANRATPLPWYVDQVMPSGNQTAKFWNWGRGSLWHRNFNWSAVADATLTDRTLTFTYTGRTDFNFLHYGPDCGDILFDSTSRSVFWVSARSGTSVTAILQNNYKITSGVYSYPTAISLVSGTVYFRSTRQYCPQRIYLGDISPAGGTTISNVGSDDGTCTVETDLAVGDAILVNDYLDRWTSGDPTIAGLSNSGKTITITTAATMKTATDRWFQLFVRQPPASV